MLRAAEPDLSRRMGRFTIEHAEVKKWLDFWNECLMKDMTVLSQEQEVREGVVFKTFVCVSPSFAVLREGDEVPVYEPKIGFPDGILWRKK